MMAKRRCRRTRVILNADQSIGGIANSQGLPQALVWKNELLAQAAESLPSPQQAGEGRFIHSSA